MKKKGLIAAVVAFALLMVASPAQADVIGGGGTSSGGALSSGGLAPANWDRVVGVWDPSAGGAYDDFLAAATGNGRYAQLNSAARVEGHLRDMGILDQCKSARLIVYLRDENYGVWMRYTSGFGITDEVRTDDWTTTPGRGHVFIEERNAGGQPSWNQNWSTTDGRQISPKKEVQDYAGGASRDTNIICAWGAGAKTSETSYSRNSATVSDSETWTKPYAWNTSVQREITGAVADSKDVDLEGMGDPIGKNNLENQKLVSKKSAYAGVYDNLVENESVEAKRNRVAAAMAADAKAGHAQVELTEGNKAGLAEGGVLSVYEQTQYATISSSQTTSWQRCNQVTNERYWNGSQYTTRAVVSGPIGWNDSVCNNAPLVGGNPSYNATNTGAAGFPSTGAGWRAGATSYSNNKNLGTLQNTGFWQILSVHCNPAELAALLNSVAGETVVSQTAGVDGKSTTVVHSQRYGSRPGVVDFGVDRKDGTPKSRTGQLGFYDKECDLTCISTPTAATGASSTNGALSNVSGTTNQEGKDYNGGSVLNGDVNSNYLEIFRDNADRKVAVNVAYPSNADPQFKYGKTYTSSTLGSVTIPAAAPISTTVTRWEEGTPSTSANSGGEFSMSAVAADGKTTKSLFDGTSAKPATQTNWGSNPYQTANSTTLNGFYRNFVVQSTWASESNRPQVVNVKWEYQPTVWTRFPSNVGFSSTEANTINIADYTVRDQALDGKCYAQYGATPNKIADMAGRVQASTGTGTQNVLDSGLVEGANGDNSWQTQTNLVLKFVRAVSE